MRSSTKPRLAAPVALGKIRTPRSATPMSVCPPVVRQPRIETRLPPNVDFRSFVFAAYDPMRLPRGPSMSRKHGYLAINCPRPSSADDLN
jgi:hypothetical protein